MFDEKSYKRGLELIRTFQRNYEDSHEDHPLVKKSFEGLDFVSNLCDTLEDMLQDAQNLGFIQGMSFANQVMSTSAEKNRNPEFIKDFIELLSKKNNKVNN